MMSGVHRFFFALGIVLSVGARGVDGRIECYRHSSSEYFVRDTAKCWVDTMNKRFGGDEKLMNKCYSDGRHGAKSRDSCDKIITNINTNPEYNTGPTIKCHLGYSSKDECEKGTAKLEAIMTDTCKNNATYTNDADVRCICEPGWVGSTCAVNVDDCLGVTCSNHGTCVDGDSTYTCNCDAGYASKDDCAISTPTTTPTASTNTTTTTTTKKPSCYPRLTFAPPSTLPSSPSAAWDATNVALLGWPTLLGVKKPLVLEAPDVPLLETIRRQTYDDACLAEHPRLANLSNPAPVATSNLTYRLLWTRGVSASNNTVQTGGAFANSSDYVGQPPPPGLVQTGQEGAPALTIQASGTIVWLPEQRGNYTMWLVAGFFDGRDPNLRAEFGSDSATTQRDDQIVVASWDFEVTEPPSFVIDRFARAAVDADDSKAYVGLPATKDGAELDLAAGETYRVAPIDPDTIASNIQELTGNSEESLQYSLTGAPPGFFIDGNNAEISAVPTEVTPPVDAANPSKAVWTPAQIIATDPASGLNAVVQTIEIRVRKKDEATPANGPNGKDCLNSGIIVDDIQFNNEFACNCSNTRFTGDNCESKPPEPPELPAPSGSTGAAAGAVAGVFTALILAVGIGYRYRVRQLSMRAFDFEKQLDDLMASGEIDPALVGEGGGGAVGPRLPREINRASVTTTQVVGEGTFGEVWKAVLDESRAGGVPGYLVAVKTSKDATGDGADELRKEALVMAQVVGHPNVVALIGVVTSGTPLMLLLSFCENGSLLSCLKTKKFSGQTTDASGGGYSAPAATASLKIALEVASGMAHLAKAKFVHRDLAARNVLVDSQVVCKIADFGLSRGIVAKNPDDENAQEYYASSGGKFPVRWTAPEAMETMKYSAATDVWSYGVVLVEVTTGGMRPYNAKRSNKEVIAAVQGGYRQPRPQPGCSETLYTDVMLKCWDADPTQRPGFDALITILQGQLQALAQQAGLAVAPSAANAAASAGAGGGGAAAGAQASEEYLVPGVPVQSTSALPPPPLGEPEYELEPPAASAAQRVGELDEDGYQRPGGVAAAPPAPAPAPAPAPIRSRLTFEVDDDSAQLLFAI